MSVRAGPAALQRQPGPESHGERRHAHTEAHTDALHTQTRTETHNHTDTHTQTRTPKRSIANAQYSLSSAELLFDSVCEYAFEIRDCFWFKG